MQGDGLPSRERSRALGPAPDLAPGSPDDPRINAALASFPIEPLPPGFMRRTTARIETEAASGRARRPVAHPTGSAGDAELAVAACVSLTLAAGLALAAWCLRQADPLWLADLRLLLQSGWLGFSAGTPLPPGSMPLLLAMTASMIAGLLLLISEGRLGSPVPRR